MKYLTNLIPQLIVVLFFVFSSIVHPQAQVAECPYPVLFMHGWTGSNLSWEDWYTSADVNAIWGSFDTDDHVFWAMPNAEDTHVYYEDCCTFLCLFQCTYIDDDLRNDNINGSDGVWSNNGTDDDVQWVFPNEDNTLLPGCTYAYSFNVGKDDDGTIFKNSSFSSTAPCDDCSDNNESAAYKQGYAVKRAIEAVLAANPGKEKVVLVGHSMGGMAGREYIQRTDANGNPTWWIDPSSPDGHKVAKFATLGSPLKGSNTAGNIFSMTDPDQAEKKMNDLPDLYSEAIRDIRYSIEEGSFADDVPGTYMYGGTESDIPTFGGMYHSHDVNCDGDDDDVIMGLNIDGTTQGYAEVWDGTTYNPAMPLPANLKYTYYVSDGDGVVDEKRQWLYLGGNGEVNDFSSEVSIAQPFDGVNNRLSDRVNSSLFHTSQNNDVNGIARLLDEGDYPFFAYEVDTSAWFFGTVQQRADLVPMDSEMTNSGDPLVDGDWYFYELADTVYQIDVGVIPHSAVHGRLDVYKDPNVPSYDNDNSMYSTTWSSSAIQQNVSLPVDMYLPGIYYIRITHDINTYTGNIDEVWKTPYTFKINATDQCPDYLYISDLQDDAIYNIGQVIDSDATLSLNSNIEYHAGDTISLLNGFETKSGVEFLAKISGCINY